MFFFHCDVFLFLVFFLFHRFPRVQVSFCDVFLVLAFFLSIIFFFGYKFLLCDVRPVRDDHLANTLPGCLSYTCHTHLQHLLRFSLNGVITITVSHFDSIKF